MSRSVIWKNLEELGNRCSIRLSYRAIAGNPIISRQLAEAGTARELRSGCQEAAPNKQKTEKGHDESASCRRHIYPIGLQAA
jgi:hypothetical protein